MPRDQWRFAREEDGQVVESNEHIYMASGFEAGKIYELVYNAKDPSVVGLGPAAIRDVMSYAKYDEESLFPVEHGVAFGVSQTGRFLRHFIYQGFNTDEKKRKVYDGLLIHTAGAGRGSFNHRFGQPSRDAHRYSAFFYPTDIFPFTSWTQRDPETGQTDGLFAHMFDPAHLPKVFYTNSGYEYWGRAASLIHLNVDSSADVALYPNERIYHLASGQHSVGRFPPSPESRLDSSPAYRGNPVDFFLTLRSLLVSLVEWVHDGTEPPPAAYPTISAGTLVSIDRVKFPKIPNVAFPRVIHEAYRADYGPKWKQGIVEIQPPKLGKPFLSLVSQVDELGNEVAGVKTVEILAPLGTYAPWNLRTGMAGRCGRADRFHRDVHSPTANRRRTTANRRPPPEYREPLPVEAGLPRRSLVCSSEVGRGTISPRRGRPSRFETGRGELGLDPRAVTIFFTGSRTCWVSIGSNGQRWRTH